MLDPGLDSRATQIGHTVANSLPSLRRFFEAVLPKHEVAEMEPTNCCMFWHNTASIVKI